MGDGNMHANEVATDEHLVRRMLVRQFPQWAELPLRRVRSAGTDHAIYRLGEEMAVRLPRVGWAVEQVNKEQRWLPVLAPQLPLAIPTPLGKGRPAEGYPWDWSIYRWLDGENATLECLGDPRQAAEDLGVFVKALRQIDPTGGPPAGAHNFGRGVPLRDRDAQTRAAISALEGSMDTATLSAAWEAAMAVPAWDHQPVWIHGDLQPGNILAVAGRVSAVIDFGGLGLGDPACDVIVAWTLFSAEGRAAYRAALEVDDATWARGCGWALSIAVIQLPYYCDTNPELAATSRWTIGEVLAEHERSPDRGGSM